MTRKGFAGLTILLATALLMGAAAAAPYYWMAAMAPEVKEAGDTLAFLESKMGDTKVGGPSVRINADAVYVKGATPGLAGAELQRIVANLAQTSGMALDKMEVLASEERDGATVLRLDVETAGNIESLRTYLHSIETSAPLIFVREAHVGVAQQDGDAAVTLPSERLTVGLQLEALAWWSK